MKPDTETVKQSIMAMPEDAVKALGAFCVERGAELEKQRHERVLKEIADKMTALEQWKREVLEKNGIEPEFEKKNGKRKKPAPTGFKAKSGHTYQHPDDAGKTWSGVGVKPGWVVELLKQGREPKDLGAKTAPALVKVG